MSKERPPLFSRVKCRAYLREKKDGIYIDVRDKDGNVIYPHIVTEPLSAYAVRYDPQLGKLEKIADLSNWDGESVKKIYRERTEAVFTGVVVGYKRIDRSGYIGTDWETPPFGREYGHLFKEINDRPEVAVVYYRNNKKRFVLPEDMEEERNE